jgi:hypothetical protein
MMNPRWMRVRTLLMKALRFLSRHRRQRYPWAEFRRKTVSADAVIIGLFTFDGSETDGQVKIYTHQGKT